MPAPEIIQKLVQRFSDHKAAYRSHAYNEAQLRQEFLNPFFDALGWDVANKKDYAVQYREVIHEDSIHVKGSPNAKAPDYAFRLGGVRKFFVEAKKPAEDIANTREFAYQLKIYAWSAKLPLSILTDFEEFAVYDCRTRPNRTDSPATSRVLLIKYTEYLERWDEIAGIFSPDAIRKGAFDKYAEDNTVKKGTTSVDEAFLHEIETWRTLLARNIALRNPQVTHERQLNFAVQMTIDRIIFLRICEDRGIEPVNQLLEIGSGKEIYSKLVQLFQRADLRYNSGLFHFKAERGVRNQVDSFTPSLAIDDRVLKTVIRSLYYPCPYVFREIPVEILGQVYEQFLGKVIRLTPGGMAKVEEKPEVRKAGGVYYTPKYIVDYIVANTVGELLKDKTPNQAAQLKIVDPACGSGSFLLGAFQYLMDWHEEWYLGHDPERWTKGSSPAIVQTGDGDWRLTTEEKKRILVNNLYGVDIDAQAVEVTKLSLLLKVLEEETGQLTLGFERALPDLSDNIKCGNSLIGWDYFEGQLLPDEEEVARVNPFDWHKAFPAVFASGANGGFDVVIGNPPYIHSRDEQIFKKEKEYFLNHFLVAEYQLNTFSLFIEKGLLILREKGLFGMIIPNYWLSTKFDYKLRKLIFISNNPIEITNTYNIFKSASVDTLILIIMKYSSYKQEKTLMVKSVSRELTSIEERLEAINSKNWKHNKRILIRNHDEDIKVTFSEKISLFGTYKCIGDFFNLKFGMKPYQVGKGNPPQSKRILIEKPFTSIERIGDDFLPLLKARNVKRFNIKGSNDWIKYGPHLAEPREISLFQGPRLILQRIVSGEKVDITYTELTYVCNTDIISLKPHDDLHGYDIKYFLGLLSSTFAAFNIRSQNVNLDRKTFPKINTKTLNNFPIPVINFSKDNNVIKHNKMVALVNLMLDLHKRMPQTPFEQEQLQREIAATDAQIDRLVYALYGLTEEEIRIVEGEN